MKAMQAVKHACRDERKKFYRGEESRVKECQMLKCNSSAIEQKVVSYVSKIYTYSNVYVLYFCLAYWQSVWMCERWLWLWAIIKNETQEL